MSIAIDLEIGAALDPPILLSSLTKGDVPVSVTSTGELALRRRRPPTQLALLKMDPIIGVPAGNSKTTFDRAWLGADLVWSPDGKKLYSLRGSPKGPLIVERELALNIERLIPPPASIAPIFFTVPPDGKSFTLYGNNNGERGFFEFRPQTGDIQLLWTSKEGQNPPAQWSPDGKELLFSSWPQKDRRLPVLVLRVSDKQIRTVAHSRSRPFPKWSPDGSKIAYTDKECLLEVSAMGGTPRQIVCAPPIVLPSVGYLGLGGISWSPDGRKLAWTVQNPEEKRVEIWIVDVSTSSYSAIPGGTDYSSWPSDPSWSPDGKRIAFLQNHPNEYEIWRLSHFLPTKGAPKSNPG